MENIKTRSRPASDTQWAIHAPCLETIFPMMRKKKPTKDYNPKAIPSEKSQWAYWMQAIEPCDPAIDEAFPGYHPLWVQRSQRLSASGNQFKYFRQHLLCITQKQCAAYAYLIAKQSL